MFDVFGRSWHLTKLSFEVIRQDKEMLAFPLLSGIFSLLYLVALVYPTIVVDALRSGGESVAFDALDYIILFAAYVGLAFITTFFNVCVVYTTKTRFEGGDATFIDSIRFAGSRLHHIVAWSLVSATVGMLLQAIHRAAERAGPIGRIVVSIIASLLGAAWTVLTLFVIPAMVYDDVGPIDAIKRSAETLRATWGESLVRHYGLGFIQAVCIVLGILVAVPCFMLTADLGIEATLVVAGSLFVYLLAVVLVFAVANGVFNTALYVYATSGETPGEFDDHTLGGAFAHRD